VSKEIIFLSIFCFGVNQLSKVGGRLFMKKIICRIVLLNE